MCVRKVYKSVLFKPRRFYNLSIYKYSMSSQTTRDEKYQIISMAKKERLISMVFEQHQSVAQAARALIISPKTARSIVKRWQESGSLELKPRGGKRNVKIDEVKSGFLRDLLDEDNQRTLQDIKDALIGRYPEIGDISLAAIAKHIDEHICWTIKRAHRYPAARDSDEVVEQRFQFVLSLQTKNIQYLNNCIFIDKSGFHTSMIRGQARSPVGQPAFVKVRAMRATSITVIAAISPSGIESVEAKIVSGGTTGAIFLQFLRNLMATLDATNAPSFNFVMDNASIHKTAAIKHEMEASRHNLVFLPPYSPFLNPIEEFFSKFKGLVKRTRMMDNETLNQRIVDVSYNDITADNCRAWVQHSLEYQQKCLSRERNL